MKRRLAALTRFVTETFQESNEHQCKEDKKEERDGLEEGIV